MDNKLKFLFLDDNQPRHIILQGWYQNADHCYGYADCIEKLILSQGSGGYDIVSLDHDLNEEDTLCIPGVTNRGRTGTDVAQFIASLKTKPNIAILHSHNPAGLKSMAGILSEVGVTVYKIPFAFNPAVYKNLAEIAK